MSPAPESRRATARLRSKRKVRIRLELREVWRSSRLDPHPGGARPPRPGYQRAVLGFVWAILTPFVMMVVFTVFFQRVAEVDTSVPRTRCTPTWACSRGRFFSSGVRARRASCRTRRS